MDHPKLHNALKAILIKYRRRNPVVIYGDLCLGFNNEMQSLMAEYGTVKIDCLNCIDCLLGGHKKLLDIDPDHHFFFLTPGFMDFSERMVNGTMEENRHCFNMLKEIIFVDSLNNIELYQSRIKHFSEQSGLPIKTHPKTGLSGLRNLIEDAIQKNHK